MSSPSGPSQVTPLRCLCAPSSGTEVSPVATGQNSRHRGPRVFICIYIIYICIYTYVYIYVYIYMQIKTYSIYIYIYTVNIDHWGFWPVAIWNWDRPWLGKWFQHQTGVPGDSSKWLWQETGFPGHNMPSGKHTKSYWKWPFIVDLPIKNGDFTSNGGSLITLGSRTKFGRRLKGTQVIAIISRNKIILINNRL